MYACCMHDSTAMHSASRSSGQLKEQESFFLASWHKQNQNRHTGNTIDLPCLGCVIVLVSFCINVIQVGPSLKNWIYTNAARTKFCTHSSNLVQLFGTNAMLKAPDLGMSLAGNLSRCIH